MAKRKKKHSFLITYKENYYVRENWFDANLLPVLPHLDPSFCVHAAELTAAGTGLFDNEECEFLDLRVYVKHR